MLQQAKLMDEGRKNRLIKMAFIGVILCTKNSKVWVSRPCNGLLEHALSTKQQ